MLLYSSMNIIMPRQKHYESNYCSRTEHRYYKLVVSMDCMHEGPEG